MDFSMLRFHRLFLSIQIQVGYHLECDLDTGWLSGLSLRLWIGYGYHMWVGYGYHKRTIHGHESGSGMIFRCDAGLG